MKKLLSIVLAVFCICLCFGNALAGSNPTGFKLDQMVTTDLNGNEVIGEIFSEYKLTYLNLWATWCGPCLSELPHIQAMYEDEDMTARGLNVMGLLWEDSSSTVKEAKKVLSNKGCTYTNIRIGNDAQLNALVNNSGNGIPVSYLLNSEGEVIKYTVGSMSKTAMKNFINQGFAMVETEPTPTPTQEPTAEPTVEPTGEPEVIEYNENATVLGDTNGDDTVNTADATVVLKFAAEMITLDEQQTYNADANRDGIVNTADATTILKHSAEIQLLPEKKAFSLTVIDNEQKETHFKIETYAEYLREPLEKNGVIAGTESDYGMFVTTVNGLEANSDNMEWWCLTRDGGIEVLTGVDSTPVKDGSVFEFTFTVGYPEYKEVKLTVMDNEQQVTEFTLYTTSEFLGNALKAYDLIDGYETEYGFFVTTVNGLEANMDNQEWWCLTKGGEMLETGVDSTPVANGDAFEFTFTVGW